MKRSQVPSTSPRNLEKVKREFVMNVSDLIGFVIDDVILTNFECLNRENQIFFIAFVASWALFSFLFF